MQERDGMVLYGELWYGGVVVTAVQYGMVTCGMVRYGVVWSDVVCVV
jgi:hypothetical protein